MAMSTAKGQMKTVQYTSQRSHKSINKAYIVQQLFRYLDTDPHRSVIPLIALLLDLIPRSTIQLAGSINTLRNAAYFAVPSPRVLGLNFSWIGEGTSKSIFIPASIRNIDSTLICSII